MDEHHEEKVVEVQVDADLYWHGQLAELHNGHDEERNIQYEVCTRRDLPISTLLLR